MLKNDNVSFSNQVYIVKLITIYLTLEKHSPVYVAALPTDTSTMQTALLWTVYLVKYHTYAMLDCVPDVM